MIKIKGAGGGGGGGTINDFATYPADFSTGDDVIITEGELDTSQRIIMGVLRAGGGS